MKDLSLHIIDILQNSTRAKATKIELDVEKSTADDKLVLRFKDNGCGMDETMVKKVTEPFFTTRTTRKVGLGLPLIKMNTENCGGGMKIVSEVGKGTRLDFWFQHNHWDRPPMGDLAGTIVMLCSQHEDRHIIYRHITDKDEFVFDTDEVKEALDGASMNDLSIFRYLKDMVKENLEEIGYSD